MDEWWDRQDDPHQGIPSNKNIGDGKKQVVEYSEDGSIVNSGNIFRKTKTKEEEWNSDGTLIREESLKDGVRDGLSKKYYENGTLKVSSNWSNGKINGEELAYYSNGTLRLSTPYSENSINGTKRGYYEDGSLEFEKRYIFDVGYDEKYFYRDGVLASEKIYISTNEGSYDEIEYHPNGQLKSKFSLRDYVPSGTVEYYYDNGQLESIATYNDEGDIEGSRKTYYPNGQLNYEQYYFDGELNGPSKAYYENGQLEEESNYLDGELQGVKKTYHENGQLEGIGEFVEGEKQGVFKLYNEDGSLYSISEYDNGGLVSVVYAEGEVATDDNYRAVIARDIKAKQQVKSKEQIVGERGIENANDKVAQKDLETAKLMASNNRPSTDIKRATGWEMGADGKWRYEYPNVTLKDDLQDENDFRLVVKGYNQSQGISDRFETKPPAIPLSEILNFGELQKAYPYIEDLYFELDDSLQSEAYGQLDIARGLVSLNPKIINQVGIDEVQKVLIHEIQHYIQDQEGFENGGNVEMMQDRINRSQDV